MKRTAALLTCLALLIPGAAVASANSTSQNYSSNNTGHKVDHATAHRSPSSKTTSPATSTASPSSVQSANATRSANTGSLPFTGLDVGGLAAGAVVLLGAGLLLRRSTARRDS